MNTNILAAVCVSIIATRRKKCICNVWRLTSDDGRLRKYLIKERRRHYYWKKSRSCACPNGLHKILFWTTRNNFTTPQHAVLHQDGSEFYILYIFVFYYMNYIIKYLNYYKKVSEAWRQVDEGPQYKREYLFFVLRASLCYCETRIGVKPKRIFRNYVFFWRHLAPAQRAVGDLPSA